MITAVLLIATPYLAFMAALLSGAGARIGTGKSPPIITAAVFAVTACFSGLQFIFPSILTDLRRDVHLLAAGQWWRLVTPLFVQDGGLWGTVFNLTFLLLLGLAVERLLGWRRWLLLYFGTGIIAEIVAYSLLRQEGAGNSIANLGLAAGLVILALTSGQLRGIAAGSLGALSGLALLVMGDLHGAAFLVGCLLAVGATAMERRRASGLPA